MSRVLAERAPDLDETGTEVLIDDVLAEVERRTALGGALYPFSRRTTGLHRREQTYEAQLLYTFLVLSSAHAPFRQSRPGFSPGRLFERVAANALEAWTEGTAVVFADIDETGVRARIDHLGRRLNVASSSEKARKRRNDHGLDVAAWRDFGDRRAGYPVVLCQCTIAWKLVEKAREVQVGEWGGMLDVREGTFIAAIAAPHALDPDYEHWDELRRNTDLILERTRLLALLGNVDEPWAPLISSAQSIIDGLAEWQGAQTL